MVRPEETTDEPETGKLKKRTYKLTKDFVRKASEPRIYWDSVTRNFGVKVSKAGTKTYVVKYRVRGARGWRQATICKCDAKSLDEARKEALRIIGLAADRKDYLARSPISAAIPTLSEWVSEYLQDVRKRKKNSKEDERYLKFACRTLGNTQLNCIKPADISNLRRKISDGGEKSTTGNRFLASIRKCLNDAMRAGAHSRQPRSVHPPSTERTRPVRPSSDEEEWHAVP